MGALALEQPLISSDEVILTGFVILILIAILIAAGSFLCYYASSRRLWEEISQVEQAVKPKALFVAAFFVLSIVHNWQDYSYPFVAGLQLRSINVTLEAPVTRIQSKTADNFTVAVLSPYLKGIRKMDLQMQETKGVYPLKFFLFPVPNRCRGGMLGLVCDMEKEAALAVKNTGGRLQHMCSWTGYMSLSYIDPETRSQPKYFKEVRNETIRTYSFNSNVDSWNVFAAVHCGKRSRNAIQIEGRAGLQGRSLFGYLMDLGVVNLFAIYLALAFMIGLFYLILRSEKDAARVEKIYQQIRKNERNDGATMGRAKRLVQYDRIRKKLDKLRQKHQNAHKIECEKHSAMRRNRVRRELTEIAADPLPGLEVAVSISSDRYVFFLLKGCTQTPFQGGIYCGMICVPPNYPFKPPTSYVMVSPSGGYFFREGIQWNNRLKPKSKWNPVSSSLRDCFVTLLSHWTTCKLDWNFNEARAEVLAKWSFESCVELCPDFYDLFPAYSSVKHNKKDDDIIIINIMKATV